MTFPVFDTTNSLEVLVSPTTKKKKKRQPTKSTDTQVNRKKSRQNPGIEKNQYKETRKLNNLRSCKVKDVVWRNERWERMGE